MKQIIDAYRNKQNDSIFPFFWLHGEDEEKLIEYMEAIRKANITSVCIESRPHPDFLGEKWWRDLDVIIAQAKKLGMRVWILDDKHFPTGYANGLISTKYPERRKKLLTHRIVNIVGPQKDIGVHTVYLTDPDAKLISVFAKCQGKTVDLSKEIGNSDIYFSIPEGNWEIYLLYETSQSEYNPDYINMVDEKSCKVLIEAVYEPHYLRYGHEFGTTIAGFFSDEPGFMNEKGTNNDSVIGKMMPLPWGEELQSELRKYFGDEFHQFLPDLWYESDTSSKTRYVYMDICTKLYQKNFSEKLGKWCRERNVDYIGHVIEDRDSSARLGVGAGHFFRSMSGQSMSGIDIVLNQLLPGMDEGDHQTIRGKWDNEFFHYALGKMGSSLAQIDPSKSNRTMIEVFGAYGWHEGTKLMKWILDHFLVRGLNQFVPHAFSPKAFPDVDCPPHFYANGNNPQYRFFGDLMAYLNRMCTILDQAKCAAKVAVLYHAEAEWTGRYMLPQKITKILTQNQVEFNIIPNDVFDESGKYPTTWNKKLCVNGTEYSTFILPEAEYMDGKLLEQICSLKHSETDVIFINTLPVGTFDGKNEQLLSALQEKPFVKLIQLNNVEGYLTENQLSEIEISQPERDLRIGSFIQADSKVYMFFNENPNKPIRTDIKFAKRSVDLFRYDVLNNTITKCKNEEMITLNLSPYESVVYFDGSIDSSVFTESSEREYRKELRLGLPETVSFASAKRYPEFTDTIELDNYMNLSKAGLYPGKSGTFRYTYSLDLPEEIRSGHLDMGDVYEIAEVFINGNNYGKKICPPYELTIEHLPKGLNRIDIEVTNTLDKQVPDYFSLGEAIQPSGLMAMPVIYY